MYNEIIKQREVMLMAPETQTITNNTIINNSYSEQDAIQALYTELQKGIQSMRNREASTIEEAWEEIDKI